MSRRYKFRDAGEMYFITFPVVYWIDLFIRPEYREIVLGSWKYCQHNKGLEIYGWCIMTSHIHMIIATRKNKPEDIMRDMKKHTSEKLAEAIKAHHGESRKGWMLAMMAGAGKKTQQRYRVWQEGNHPIAVTSDYIAHQKLDYIHDNPVVSGVVEKSTDYLFSSARDYHGLKGLCDIVLLDPLIV